MPPRGSARRAERQVTGRVDAFPCPVHLSRRGQPIGVPLHDFNRRPALVVGKQGPDATAARNTEQPQLPLADLASQKGQQLLRLPPPRPLRLGHRGALPPSSAQRSLSAPAAPPSSPPAS